jgi:hypothetical protein
MGDGRWAMGKRRWAMGEHLCCKLVGPFFRLRYGRSPVVTFFQKLFSKKSEPVKRVRVCVECGMPVAEHKDWCSIYRTQQEMEKKGPSAARA